MKHLIHTRRRNKVSVIGAGLVGSTYAYTLMLSGAASEIVLLDACVQRAEGEAMDLSHGAPFAPPVRIRSGDWEATSNSDIVVITAGAAQKPGETRLDLAKRNVEVFRDIVPKAAAASPDSIMLVVTNPVDLMAYAAIVMSGFPASRVIGSGTLLDSARLRQLIGEHCKVAPGNVHAYIIGEHGDSEVPLWSTANIAGLRLDEYCPVCGRACDSSIRTRIFEEVRDAAYAVIERKGATYYAIALALTAVTRAILRDESAVMTVSCLIDGFCGARDICLSLPAVINRSGVDRFLHIPLTEDECENFEKSARVLQDAAVQVGLRN
ncbi:MAG TPA: L-lactate dehydrogenase [Bacillota bacterium]|nr:L-lactate dehydrogenase [Bacillota bacterium]